MQAVPNTCLATPMLYAVDMLERVLDEEHWADVRQDVVEVYLEWVLARTLTRVIEQTVPPDRLARLPSESVQLAVLLLLRDMFRHHAEWIQTRETCAVTAGARVDRLFDQVAARLGLVLPPGPRFSLDDVTDDGWAIELGASLGVVDPVQVTRLVVWHAAVTAGMRETAGL